MNENENSPEDQPAETPETPEAPATAVADPAKAPKTRWRHRRLALPIVAGIALGGLAVGAGGAVVIDHVSGHDRPGHVQREDVQPGDGHRHHGGMMAPPGGQLPPGVAPDQDADTDTDTESDTSSSGEEG